MPPARRLNRKHIHDFGRTPNRAARGVLCRRLLGLLIEEPMSKSLILRTCRADSSSKNGFVWPEVGQIAKAPDWNSTPDCGNGLHGWLFGQGDHTSSNYLG